MNDSVSNEDIVGMSAELTMAWISNPSTHATLDEVASFLKSAHATLLSLSTSTVAAPAPVETGPVKGMVSERASLSSPDHIVSMIDGRPYRTLRRHLSSNGMTPAQYIANFGLKADYPMVAPSYSQQRSDMAKKAGLGRKPGTRVVPKTKVAKAK